MLKSTCELHLPKTFLFLFFLYFFSNINEFCYSLHYCDTQVYFRDETRPVVLKRMFGF